MVFVVDLLISLALVQSLKPTAVRILKSGMKMTSTVPNPAEAKPLPKVEGIKDRSNYLRTPLAEELGNDEIFVSQDAVVVLKYHGSYMQDNRDNRKKDAEKDYQFMLRLKSPCGIIPPELYLKLDDLADRMGQGDLRATTRQAFQIHGILKGNLKTVISTIMEAGSSTIGACGDVSRNVMCSPAPFKKPEYEYARQYSKVIILLLRALSPMVTSRFFRLWLIYSNLKPLLSPSCGLVRTRWWKWSTGPRN